MTQEKIAYYFDQITTLNKKLSETLKISETEALIESVDILNGLEPDNMFDEQSKLIANNLQSLSHRLNSDIISTSELRKLMQLVILQVNKNDNVEANKQITPDGIGYLLADFLVQTADLQDNDTLLDLTVGTGNLLNTVNDVLEMNKIHVKRVGVDSDESQIATAVGVDAMINKKPAVFYHDDVIHFDEQIQAKAIIADLPVGYYPLEINDDYQTKVEDGLSYSHYLMIERSLNFLDDNGWAYFIVPASMLTGENATNILKFIATQTRMRAFLRLPSSFFKDPRAAKAILVIQKKDAKPTSEVLMGEYPNLKDIATLKKFLQDIKAWVTLIKENGKA